MNIRQRIKNFLNPQFKDSASFSQYLIKKGCAIGEGTYFFDPKNIHIDEDNAQFINIGKYCKITTGVYILAHDYSYSILRRVYNDIPKKAGLTKIGDNCFIGINSIILMGSKIGNNVIIGAGSVVSGTIPDNEVWGGNPARFICTLDEYYEKCKKSFEENAKLYLNQYYNVYKRVPSIQELQYFSMLFLNNDKSISARKEYEKMKFSGDNKEEVLNTCLNFKSKYKNYNEFIEKNLQNYENENIEITGGKDEERK